MPDFKLVPELTANSLGGARLCVCFPLRAIRAFCWRAIRSFFSFASNLLRRIILSLLDSDFNLALVLFFISAFDNFGGIDGGAPDGFTDLDKIGGGIDGGTSDGFTDLDKIGGGIDGGAPAGFDDFDKISGLNLFAFFVCFAGTDLDLLARFALLEGGKDLDLLVRFATLMRFIVVFLMIGFFAFLAIGFNAVFLIFINLAFFLFCTKKYL